MCGRFTLTVDPADLQEAFPWIVLPRENIAPRYNIAPSQPIAVVPNTGDNRLDFYIWGLIPSWSKGTAIGHQLINARSETLAEKPSFRSALRRRRCIIPADGFYEWKSSPGNKSKDPYYIHLKSGRPFAFAGLWEIWHSTDGTDTYSCTIITTTPNELIQPIHPRMPVILRPDDYKYWLNPEEQAPESLTPLLKPYPATELDAYPISRYINSPNNDSPECILRVTS